MKKLLGISLIAVLAVSPMMAFAADPVPVTGTQPTAADPAASTNVATASPQYALKPAANTDSNMASAGYVKGAYNAAIKAINKVDSLKQDKIDANNKLAASNVSGLAAVATSGNASDLTQDATHRLVTDTEKSTWSGKQAALTETQLAAVNSGITSAKVSTYDGYANGKQDTIDSTHKLSASLVDGLAAVATSGNASDLTQDATHRLVTDTEKSTWNGKQAALTETQLAAVNSGITSAKVTDYDNLVTASANYAKRNGVEQTIKNTQLNQGAVTQGVSGAISGTTSTIATVMTNWEDDSTHTDIEAITAVSNGTLTTNVSVAAPTIKTASVSYTEPS